MVPSAQRNAAAILQVLQAHAPATGRTLEIASGSGLHAALFAAALPGLIWQTTDLDRANFASIRAWAAASAGNILPPVPLDATQAGWSADWPAQDAVLLVNLLHLIPPTAAATLLDELAQVLAPGGTAFLYGPFLRDGAPTSDGDAAFDASLRAQNPAIGYKDLAWVTGILTSLGLQVQTQAMPANNLMLIVRR
jgi:SAM-dependent methyltransferase